MKEIYIKESEMPKSRQCWTMTKNSIELKLEENELNIKDHDFFELKSIEQHDKEVRNQAIKEFANKICDKISNKSTENMSKGIFFNNGIGFDEVIELVEKMTK